MSVKCSRTFTLREAGGITCPMPVPVTFTIPDTENKVMDDQALNNFVPFAIVNNTQCIARSPLTWNTHCIEIVDFSGVPAVTSQFQLNSETGWEAITMFYESHNNEIVVCALKSPNYVLAFFDPVTGYKEHISIPVPVNSSPFWLVPLRGQSGKIAMASMRDQADAKNYIFIIDVTARSIQSIFTLTPAPVNYFISNSFAFSCSRNEFYICHSDGNIWCIDASDGSTKRTIPNGTDVFCYCDLQDHLVTANTTLNTLQVIDLDDGSILTTVDPGTEFLGNLYWFYLEGIHYDFKLNSVVFSTTIELDSDSSYSGGIFAVDPSTLGYLDHCICHNASLVDCDPIYIQSDYSTGDIVSKAVANGIDFFDPDTYPFYQVRATMA